jgi:hypothetical protein
VNETRCLRILARLARVSFERHTRSSDLIALLRWSCEGTDFRVGVSTASCTSSERAANCFYLIHNSIPQQNEKLCVQATGSGCTGVPCRAKHCLFAIRICRSGLPHRAEPGKGCRTSSYLPNEPKKCFVCRRTFDTRFAKDWLTALPSQRTSAKRTKS